MKHTMEFEIEIDEGFIEYLTRYNDIFMSSHSGYWAYGVSLPHKFGWLVYESCDGRPTEKQERAALRAYKHLDTEEKRLPKGWHLLDRSAAIRAWCEGVKRWGIDWYERGDHDAASDDVVVQLALLGEVRYG